MTSLYDQSIPVLIKYFNNLSQILDKSIAYADEKGIAHEELLTARLRDDMKPLPFQIQAMSNSSKFLCVRAFGIENIVLEDDETTFPELRARIAKTIEILQSVDPAKIDAKKAAEEPIIMQSKMGDFKFESGQAYLSEFVIPNFHFHLSTAYCILRSLGVPLGAMDYLNGVFHKA
ncbi:hypothetical protein V500_03285 [Pseudogymnoascus sp. VKM F-4518 (FW-2643)]|nr:hypothetical protein V500_03285 [Pseudogymnoascus sp. VKM F-4518 (FW-2643)]KFZ10188.1 hypothetical protein V502_08277 [Pseudogymnoascus sp. VKM F-4520 (FW-2644)]